MIIFMGRYTKGIPPLLWEKNRRWRMHWYIPLKSQCHKRKDQKLERAWEVKAKFLEQKSDKEDKSSLSSSADKWKAKPKTNLFIVSVTERKLIEGNN